MRNLRALARTHYAELAKIGKAMGSPVRLMLIDLLRQGPRSVETLAEQAGVTTANASQHLQQLSGARLVCSEKQAQRVVYRLNDERVAELFTATRDLAEVVLPEMDRLKTDLCVLDDDARADLLAKIKTKKVTLLDVRPLEEYEAGHLAGALSIPLAELSARVRELPKSREVVAYCRGPYCTLALEAVRLLEAAGFRARHLDLGAADLVAPRRKK